MAWNIEIEIFKRKWYVSNCSMMVCDAKYGTTEKEKYRNSGKKGIFPSSIDVCGSSQYWWGLIEQAARPL